MIISIFCTGWLLDMNLIPMYRKFLFFQLWYLPPEQRYCTYYLPERNYVCLYLIGISTVLKLIFAWAECDHEVLFPFTQIPHLSLCLVGCISPGYSLLKAGYDRARTGPLKPAILSIMLNNLMLSRTYKDAIMWQYRASSRPMLA